MTALRKPTVPPDLAGELTRLQFAGFSLLPLGSGADGKAPLVPFKASERLHLGRVLGPMHRTGSTCYGIRLDRLAVIDCDENDPQLIADMEARFGASPVHVKTPRGMHLYYRAEGGQFPNLRAEGLPIDIKRGASSYVMGPCSIRPDGGAYVSAKGTLGHDALSELRTPSAQRPGATVRNGRVAEGGRNYALTLSAIQMVESVDDPEELFGNLQFIRDDECEDPATVPDSELRKIVEWAWVCRLEGKVYVGRDSAFRLNRRALDALKEAPNASDAIALFVTLQDLHGHIPAKVFALDFAGMKANGHTDLSRERFIAARRALQHAGLLGVANKHIAGKSARTYRLTRLHPSAANITALHQSHSKGRGV